MKKIRSGLEFEKIVTEIQKLIDSNSDVSHDETLIDRLGQKRQFDVVVRGKFAGQEILGVLECKDLNKKVGTPEVDAFVTKSLDVNANFKIIVSKRGFSKPALKKANHYGIQTLSLLARDGLYLGAVIGTKWYADIFYWNQFAVTLQFVKQPDKPVEFKADKVSINGKLVIDAFKNYLIEEYPAIAEEGWVVNVRAEFKKPIDVFVSESESYLCFAIDFAAHRAINKREKYVGWNGTGFYDWQRSQATFAPGSTVKSHAVPMDLLSWEKCEGEENNNHGFIVMKIIAHSAQMERVEDAIDLDAL